MNYEMRGEILRGLANVSKNINMLERGDRSLKTYAVKKKTNSTEAPI